MMRYLAYGLIILALGAAIVLGVKSCKQIDADQTNQTINAGVDAERSRSQAEVLNHVQEARNAVDAPTDAERNVVCSKYDRNCNTSGQ